MQYHPQTIAEAEKAVIGCLLLRGARIADVASILQPGHFVDGYYGCCYASLLDQHESGQPLEPIAVLNKIRTSIDHRSAEPNPAYGIGDAMYFVHQTLEPTDLHAVHYATIVAANGIRKQIANKSAAIAVAREDSERETLVSEMAELTSELNRVDGSQKYLTTLQAEVESYIDKMAASDATLVETGLPGLDASIGGGVALGELVVIGARPSNGKTLAAMQMVEHMSGQGLRSLVISEEMSSQLLAERTLSHATERDRGAWMAEADLLRVDAGIYFHQREAIYIAESCGTIKKATQQIQRAASMGCRVVAVDYAQLLRGKGNTQYERVTDVSNEMKKSAKKFNLVVLLLCQLSRPDKARKKHQDVGREQPRGVIPQKSDLRDSGYIEQDADVIVFLQWPHADNKRYQPADEYFLYVGKNRNRATTGGEIRCKINPPRQMLYMPEGFQPEDKFNPDDWS